MNEINMEGYIKNLSIYIKQIKKERNKKKFKKQIINNFNEYKTNKTEYNKSYENIIIETDSKFINSCDILYSIFSLTNWFDEYKNGDCLGLLIKLTTNSMTKFGFKIKPLINEITTSFIPSSDFLEVINKYTNEGIKTNLNNKNIFNGNAVGHANAIIPLYIHELHWMNVKKQIPILYGINIAHHPYMYNQQYDNLIFFVLISMINYIIRGKNTQNNIKILFCLYRTCCQIAYEKKYHIGIKKLLKKNIDHINERYECQFIFGQILSTGYQLPYHKINLLCNKYENKRGKEFIETFLIFNQIITILIKEYNGFKKLLHMIDQHYGIVTDEFCENIKKLIYKLSINKFNNINIDGQV